MNSFRVTVVACGLVAGLIGSEVTAVSIETVPVGNPGNVGELSGAGVGGGLEAQGPDGICGGVAYTYNIAKYEVTAGQYCEFLNAVARTDTYGLYRTSMDTAVQEYGCNIKRTGAPGAYTYTVATDWANRPVNYVTWGSAIRFVNWLHNGQPTGLQNASTTEDGSYPMNGATSDPAFLAVTRKPNATWVLPSENEWYKAAYHKNDGVTGNYWNYPTGADAEPSNQTFDPDPGNTATYYHDGTGSAIGSPYYRTEAGAHENSASPYGTFDQGGNVWEWNDTVIGSYHGLRGGGFGNPPFYMHAALRRAYYPSTQWAYLDTGFRVAYIPEPATLTLLSLGCFVALRRRCRCDRATPRFPA